MKVAWISGVAGVVGALLAAGVAWGTFSQRVAHLEERVLPLEKRGQVLARLDAAERRIERLSQRIDHIESSLRAEIELDRVTQSVVFPTPGGG